MSDDVSPKEEPHQSINVASGFLEDQSSWSISLKGLLRQASVYGIAAGYCISASLLSIINKWAVMKFLYWCIDCFTVLDKCTGSLSPKP